MNTDNRTINILKNQRGMAAIMVALCTTVLLGMAALAIDIGYLSVVKNELQNIADSAALAGANELSRQYLDDEYFNEGAIINIAGEVTELSIEVQVGTWRNSEEGFIDDDCNEMKCNAVKVTVVRDSDVNSQVPTFFAKIWNIAGLDVVADAVAALTGATEIAEGELELPVGISQQWFEDNFCDQNIQFYPTSGTDGCAGWHVYDTWPANANDLNGILAGMIDDTFDIPGYNLNDDPSFAFTGGNLSSLLDNLSLLFEKNCLPVGDPNCVWKTKVVVYDELCGENPNQTVPIIGFASVEVTGVIGPPPVLIATAKCGEVTPGAGGGTYYGTWGSIPGLVE